MWGIDSDIGKSGKTTGRDHIRPYLASVLENSHGFPSIPHYAHINISLYMVRIYPWLATKVGRELLANGDPHYPMFRHKDNYCQIHTAPTTSAAIQIIRHGQMQKGAQSKRLRPVVLFVGRRFSYYPGAYDSLSQGVYRVQQ